MEKSKLLDINELAQRISIPIPTLYTWVCLKKIPHLKLGRCLRFDSAEIEEWIKHRHVAPIQQGKRA